MQFFFKIRNKSNTVLQKRVKSIHKKKLSFEKVETAKIKISNSVSKVSTTPNKPSLFFIFVSSHVFNWCTTCS